MPPALELISRHPRGPVRPTPLLFVHGAFCGAWVWDEKFLPAMAEAGYEAHAVSLRGHGGSPGRERLAWFGIDHYIEDIVATIDRFETPPVLVGHSMGGMVVQHVMKRREVPGAVLMASTPPHGLLEPTVGMLMRSPLTFQQIAFAQALGPLGPRSVQFESFKRAMFSDLMPHDEMHRFEQ